MRSIPVILLSSVAILLPLVLVIGNVQATGTLGSQQISQETRTPDQSQGFDVQHYKIELEFNEQEKSFNGKVTIALIPLENNFTKFELDAVDMRIENVTGVPLTFQADSQKLSITLNKAYSLNDTITLSINYFSIPERGVYFIQPDEETSDIPPHIYSDSEPDEARYWFPCQDRPDDKATTELIATVKNGQFVLSNGRLLSVQENKGRKSTTFHWLQDKPHSTYLVCFVAGEFEEYQDSFDDLAVSYYFYPGQKEQALLTFQNTPRMIQVFSEKFGYPYPWDKYSQIVVSQFRAGGMENTSATILTDRTFHDKRAHIDYTSDDLVSHELAHQWFGNLVTCKDWSQIWLNEGFATYSEAIYFEAVQGKDEAFYHLIEDYEIYDRVARIDGHRPISYKNYFSATEMFNVFVYQKGAWVLHMLRFLIGDDFFFESLKQYLHQYAYDVVETKDFQSVVEKVSGQDLGWFFDQWLYQKGHPEFEVKYQWQEITGEVELQVRQILDQDSSRQAFIFKMPVEIELVSATEKKLERIFIADSVQSFRFPLSSSPLMVRFDKGNRILKTLHFIKSKEELLYQLSHDDDFSGRLEAVSQLRKVENDTLVVKALEKALLNDPFWAVRMEAADALGSMKAKDSAEALRQGCYDPHSKVRKACVEALNDIGCSDVAFFKTIASKDSSYYVEAAALNGLARSGDTTAFQYLVNALKQDSFRDVVRKAALRGLRKSGDKRALPLAMSYAEAGQPAELRYLALNLLGELGRDNEQVEDFMIKLLQDPNYYIQSRIISILGDLKSAKALPLLKEIEKSDTEERIKKKAARAIEKIQSSREE